MKLRMEAQSARAFELAQLARAAPARWSACTTRGSSRTRSTSSRGASSAWAGRSCRSTCDGGKEAAWRIVDATRLISITANLGDTKSTITHPASTTHGRITAEARKAAGIGDGLLRVAVGLESVEDLKADLARGLDG